MRATCRRPIHRYVAIIVARDPNDPDPVRGWKQPPQMQAWLIGPDYYQRARLVTVKAPAPSPPRKPAANGRRAPAGPRPQAGMVVATRTFRTRYDGERSPSPPAATASPATTPSSERNPGAFKAA